MKAAFIQQTGPPDVIQYGDLPDPEPQGAQVRVRVRAVAVNPIDTYIRNGANFWELPQPYIPGCDWAGEVERAGPDAQRFQVGDRVWGTNQGLLGRQGTFAEYCCIDEAWVYPTPDDVPDETVAASALVGVTAHLGLFREARLQEGETLFVRGGTGGVGAMVVQMAKAIGAKVITTAGNEEKAERCHALGADHVIQYRTQDTQQSLLEQAPQGVDVFWETLREPDLDQAVTCLAERGRLILMAGRDARPEFPVGPFYVKECSVHGFAMFKATSDEMRHCADEMNRWFSEGRLQAQISHRMPLAEAAAAHRLQEENTLRKAGTLAGKIVLTP